MTKQKTKKTNKKIARRIPKTKEYLVAINSKSGCEMFAFPTEQDRKDFIAKCQKIYGKDIEVATATRDVPLYRLPTYTDLLENLLDNIKTDLTDMEKHECYDELCEDAQFIVRDQIASITEILDTKNKPKNKLAKVEAF